MKKKIVLFMCFVFAFSFFNVFAEYGSGDSTSTTREKPPVMSDDSGMDPKDDVKIMPINKDLNDHDPRLKNPLLGDDGMMKTQDKEEMKSSMEEARKEMKDKIDALQADFKAKLEANKELFKKKFGSKATTIIPSRENASGRFSEALNKLISAKNNIETAIAKLKTAGKDVSTLEAKLATANTKISEAITKVETFNNLSNTADTTVKVKKAATDAKNAIIEAEKALREVIKAVRVFNKGDGIVTIPEGENPEMIK